MKVNVIHKDIQDFIKNLDDQSHAEVLRILELLEERGYEIRMPYSKMIVKNIYELRIISTQNIRIFFTFHSNEIFLLHAINKKSQKLSKKDIETAIHRQKWLH